MRRPPVTVVALALVAAFAAGPAVAQSDALRRALTYLHATQVREPVDIRVGGLRVRDEPGDWPQYFRLAGSNGFRVRDVSPFTVAFIHHALGTITDDDRERLGLRSLDTARARAMRRRAVAFLSRFVSPSGRPDAGTYGFWPYDAYPALPRPALAEALTAWLEGPILGGDRVPLNLRVFPDALAIPTDADVTATTYVALLCDARLDGGPGSDAALDTFFADWRDLGVVPRRLDPSWLPPASGAFLTWLAYRGDASPPYPNDVDLVVNANVLFALGRHGRLATPGVAESVGLINDVVAAGVHRDRPDEITNYYPDNLVFHYAVARAFGEGGVADLAPAVGMLADELEAEAIVRADGAVYWDRGAPQLNTAFAILALLDAGRDGPAVDGGVRFLIDEQGPLGGFDEATFFVARNDGGQVFEFTSRAFTTAMALQAIARATLK